jgi:hypothetical protein
MFHETPKDMTKLYPVMNDRFNPVMNIKIKGQGTLIQGELYEIIGWGYGKKVDNQDRKEFWTVIQRYNDHAKPISIWKKDMDKLYDKSAIEIL